MFWGHGEQSVPLDALPWYPARQVHWDTVVLPSGEMEFAGQVARTKAGAVELV